MAVVLGYWNIRGIAQPIRLLLKHVNQEFVDNRLNFGFTEKDYKDGWRTNSGSLGLHFPNLPYYIEGKVKLTHALAILRYLGRKHGLQPEEELDRQRVDQAEQQGYEMLWAFIGLGKDPNFQSRKPEYIENLKVQLKQLSTFLGDRQFLAGDKLTYVDFLIYEVLDQHLFLEPHCLNHHQNLQSFLRRVETLPNIIKYRSSQEFKEWPLLGHLAFFGGKGPSPRLTEKKIHD